MRNPSRARALGVPALGFFLFLSELGFAQNLTNTDGSALNLSLSPLTVNGDLTNSFDSTVTVNGSLVAGSLIPSLIVTGNLSNSFSSTVTESGLLSGGGLVTPVSMQVDGNLTNDGSSTVQLQNHSVLSVSGNVINSGLFLTGNASGDVGFNGLAIGGMLVNNPGGMLSLNASGDALYAAALVNAGTINVGNGAVVSISGALTQTAGLVDVQQGGFINPSNYLVNGGTLQVDGALGALSVTLSTGGLEGMGNIASTIANDSGMVEPGTPGTPGALTLTGDFAQGAQGTFVEQIGPTSFGALLDTGEVGLDGTLEISLQDGYIPPVGAEYLFIDSSGTLSGIFTSVIGSVIDSSEYFAVIYDPPGYPNAVELCVEPTGGGQLCAAGPTEGGGPSGGGGGASGGGGGASGGGGSPDNGTSPVASAPEPSSFLLLAGVVLAIACYGRSRYRIHSVDSRNDAQVAAD
jgi:hypothetical protein